MDLDTSNLESPQKDDDNAEAAGISAGEATPRSTKRPTTSSTKSAEKKKKNESNSRDEELEVLKSVSRALNEPDKCKDEDEAFGDWVTSHLQQLEHGRAKVLAKKLISDALFNASLDIETPPRHQTAQPNSGHVGQVPMGSLSSTNNTYHESHLYMGNVHAIHDQPPTYTNLDFYSSAQAQLNVPNQSSNH